MRDTFRVCVLCFAGSNLVGKFTQSVRRIVQDVRDEGAPSKYTVFTMPFIFFTYGDINDPI